MFYIITGIYKITNIRNTKSYVGKSNDIEKNWTEQINSLNNNSNPNYKLQNAWNTYGADNFTFEIIEGVEELNNHFTNIMRLIYLEDNYIKQYNSIINGYNLA